LKVGVWGNFENQEEHIFLWFLKSKKLGKMTLKGLHMTLDSMDGIKNSKWPNISWKMKHVYEERLKKTKAHKRH